jgi:5-methylcytosine-specific restriction enzyme subunit McrC
VTELTTGHVGNVPVRSLWLLMAYASEAKFQSNKYFGSIAENPNNIANVIALLLCDAVDTRLRRQLSVDYKKHEATLSVVRGRIDFNRTFGRNLLLQARVHCRFDTLTINNEKNRYIKGAIKALGRVVDKGTVQRQLNKLELEMSHRGVGDTAGEGSFNRHAALGVHNAMDVEVLELAKLAYMISLPCESSGGSKFLEPERAEHWVRKIFEKGIVGMLRRQPALESYTTKSGAPLKWPIQFIGAEIAEYFPGMRADIILKNSSGGNELVIDTKFTSILADGWLKDKTLKSGYIYQIYAYLRSQEVEGEPQSFKTGGLLLHPSIGHRICDSVVIQGHKITFATIDLTATPSEIIEELRRIALYALAGPV